MSAGDARPGQARWDWRGCLCVVLLMLLSIGGRLPSWTEGSGAENLEASYHVLLTMTAYEATPASEHLFLPIVTLGRAADKSVPWGAAVPNRAGDMVYTSFFPAGFALPYLALTAVGAELNLRTLALFNALLGTLNAVLFYLLAWRVAARLAPGEGHARLCAIAATLPLIFSQQALTSTGLVYWHQCVMQVVLTAFGLAILGWYSGERRAWPALVLLAFVGPLLEWSALFANAGLMLVAGLDLLSGQVAPRRQRLLLAAAVAGATVLSLAVSIAHFAAGVGLEGYLDGLSARFAGRSVAAAQRHGGGLGLLAGYIRSYGLFLVAFAAALPTAWARLRVGDTAAQAVRAILLLWFAACAENLVLLEHAQEFGFDRFKAAMPLGLVILTALRHPSLRGRFALAAAMVGASLAGSHAWAAAQAADAPWRELNARNHALVSWIDRLVDRRCAVIAADGAVRGQTTLLVMRSVHEFVTPQQFAAMTAARPACGAIYLRGREFRTDVIGYSSAEVVTPSGEHHHIVP